MTWQTRIYSTARKGAWLQIGAIALLWLCGCATPTKPSVAGPQERLFQLGVLIPGGSALDRPNRSGEMSLFFDYFCRSLLERIEKFGGSCEAQVTDDYILIHIDGLFSKQTQILAPLRDGSVFQQVDKDLFEFVKKMQIERVRALKEDHEVFLDLALRKEIFGDTPYGRPAFGNERDIEKEEVGDFASRRMTLNLPKERFDFYIVEQENIRLNGVALKPKVFRARPTSTESQKVVLVDLPNSTQAHVGFGFSVMNRRDADYLPAKLAIEVLGGSFSSRLTQEVREKRGLTYNIDANLESGYQPEAFTIEGFTDSSKVGDYLLEVKEQFSLWKEKGVTSTELERAKASFLGARKRAQIDLFDREKYKSILRFYGVPIESDQDFEARVMKISVEQVNEVLKRRFNRTLRVVILGKKSVVEPLLKQQNLSMIKKTTSEYFR